MKKLPQFYVSRDLKMTTCEYTRQEHVDEGSRLVFVLEARTEEGRFLNVRLVFAFEADGDVDDEGRNIDASGWHSSIEGSGEDVVGFSKHFGEYFNALPTAWFRTWEADDVVDEISYMLLDAGFTHDEDAQKRHDEYKKQTEERKLRMAGGR